MVNPPKGWRLGDLASELGVELHGDADIVVNRLGTLSSATSGSLSFLANPTYQKQLRETRASAVILTEAMAADCPVATLISAQPYNVYAEVSHFFNAAPQLPVGIHGSAVVANDALVDVSARIGPNVVIESGAKVGEDVEIGSGCVVGAGSVIGKQTRLHSNVTLCYGVVLGSRCVLHSGVVIGSDGFGFAPSNTGWHKIAQNGSVIIGDRVDIGANTVIDRGAIEDTLIGDGVLLDNQIQIAHNVVIGEGTAIAGQTGIAGSTKIGRHCTIAGSVGIAGHLTICDNVHITMRTAITRSINTPGSYSSGTAMSETSLWRKNAARFRRLDALAKRVGVLEKNLKT